MKIFSIISLLILVIVPTVGQAIEEQHIRKKTRTVFGLYLTPFEAYNMKKKEGNKVLLVDVRARVDLKYIGASPLIDANIPSRFFRTDFAWSDNSKTYRTSRNEHFTQDFEKLIRKKNMNKDTPIILICTSGSRVPRAANALHEAGFSKVYSQYQGFEGVKAKTGLNKGERMVDGWKNAGLPWSYKLKKEAMYFNFDSTRAQD